MNKAYDKTINLRLRYTQETVNNRNTSDIFKRLYSNSYELLEEIYTDLEFSGYLDKH